MADKKQWKRYVGYALFLFLSYSIGNAAAVVSTMTLQPEKVEKEMKTVAITFDEGPNPEYTPKLLDGLEKRGVKATFFLLGEEVKQYPDVVRRMHDDGHLIGVHSYKHVNFKEVGTACTFSGCSVIVLTTDAAFPMLYDRKRNSAYPTYLFHCFLSAI